MTTVILVIHLLITVFLIGVILLQRSEGGALGIGGGGAMGGLMNARGSANFLTRVTSILALGFMVTSLILAYLATSHSGRSSIVDQIQSAPKESPAAPSPVEPSAPLPK